MTSSILESLDDNQREAASVLEGPVRILAGAGTGKTRTITHRIAYGVSEGVFEEKKVLAVTFTIKAANEMLERLNSLGVGRVNVRTFHSEAYRQLNHYWKKFYASPTPELIPNSKVYLEKAILSLQNKKRLTIVDSKIEPFTSRIQKYSKLDSMYLDSILSVLDFAKTNLIYPKDFSKMVTKIKMSNPTDLTLEMLEHIYNEFEVVKSKANCVDFNDVIILICELVRTNPNIRASIQSLYQHIIVDEYQDVNILQQYYLDSMLGANNNICVVGDPSQTIYSFTGSTPYYLINFTDKYKNAKSISLDIDYRSTPHIVQFANQVLDNKESKKFEPISLKSGFDRGRKIKFEVFDSDDEEIEAICNQIKDDSHIDPNNTAILTRTNKHLSLFAAKLAQFKIRYNLKNENSFYSSPILKYAIRLLDSAVGKRFESVPLVEVIESILHPILPANNQFAKNNNSEIIYSEIIKLAEDFNAEETGTEALEKFMDYFNEAMLKDDTGSNNGVTLMSLHSSKGLEYDTVFLPCLYDGMLPYALAKDDYSIEEERRLLYVGITRAKKNLSMSYSLKKHTDLKTSRKRSRFLDEVFVKY
jgi:DNA helicase-2/ATP-dependent DNA helicase PcrA